MALGQRRLSILDLSSVGHQPMFTEDGKTGEIESGYYWDLLKQYVKYSNEQIKDYDTAKKGLKSLLLDSIEKRMIADVPVGTFLSGGVDSSIVTAYAREVSE